MSEMIVFLRNQAIPTSDLLPYQSPLLFHAGEFTRGHSGECLEVFMEGRHVFEAAVIHDGFEGEETIVGFNHLAASGFGAIGVCKGIKGGLANLINGL